MTVGDLIKQLQKYDPSWDILVNNRNHESLIINGTRVETDWSDFERTGEQHKIVYINCS